MGVVLDEAWNIALKFRETQFSDAYFFIGYPKRSTPKTRFYERDDGKGIRLPGRKTLTLRYVSFLMCNDRRKPDGIRIDIDLTVRAKLILPPKLTNEVGLSLRNVIWEFIQLNLPWAIQLFIVTHIFALTEISETLTTSWGVTSRCV